MHTDGNSDRIRDNHGGEPGSLNQNVGGSKGVAAPGRDGPAFRAMAMRDSSLAPIRLTLDVPQSSGSKNSKSTPLTTTTPKISRAPVTIERNNQHTHVTTSTTSNACGWNTPIEVTSMSFYYPLAPTHRNFLRTDLMQVLERLTEIFRFLSLETIYLSKPALSAICRSMDQVEFAVNLWQSRKDANQLVLEIQRVAGDCVKYCGYSRQILATAFNTESLVVAAAGVDHKQTGFGGIDLRADALLKRLPVPEPSRDATQEALELVLHMLLADRYDVRCLGLESLIILTDPSKTFTSVTTDVAHAVLLGRFQTSDGTILIDARIQERIFSLALLGYWPDTPVDDRLGEGSFAYYRSTHSYLALAVMANATSLLSRKSAFTKLLEDSSRMTKGSSSLILAMQERVWNALAEPHTAYLATRILTALCRGQPDAVRSCLEPDAVRAAQHVGHLSHAALETESGRLLVALRAG